MMLDLRKLRLFVAVAEVEHVGRAAEVLHMSQSPLSRQILRLEGRLGFRLFERSKRRIRLTREGQEFLGLARNLLAEARAVEARARRIACGRAGRLALGYVEGAVHAGLLQETVRQLRQAQRETYIELREMSSTAQLQALHRREIDCGLLYTSTTQEDPELESHLLLQERVLLAVPFGHSLAGRASVVRQDLETQTWITEPTSLEPAEDELLSLCLGLMPERRLEAAGPTTRLGLVAAGLGVTLVQAASYGARPHPNIVCRELPWLTASVRISASWRRNDTSPVLGALCAALKAGNVSPRIGHPLHPGRAAI
jgi:DNA-binding transcriptional LysR family regulator